MLYVSHRTLWLVLVFACAALLFACGLPPSRVTRPRPPAATLTIGDRAQTAGIGSYCWRTIVAGVCVDSAGIATPRDPLVVDAPLALELRLPRARPATLQWTVQPADDSATELFAGTNTRIWSMRDTATPQDLPLEQRQDVAWDAAPGRYVIAVFAAWPDRGDVGYGFYVEVQ